MIAPINLRVAIETFALAVPFRTAFEEKRSIDVVVVSLSHGDVIGRGEATGLAYLGETPERMLEQIDAIRPAMERGLDRSELQEHFPAGGARNALDCALWDLEAKISNAPAWRLAGLAPPRRLLTTFTCGADAPSAMAERALSFTGARAIKLKLTGEACDGERICQVRAALPEVWLGVDANQSLTPLTLERLMPILRAAGVALIEQPFPRGGDALLKDVSRAIPLAVDESAQTSADLEKLRPYYDVVNIKLDKAGGLTEALAMARKAQSLGFRIMVGNMLGTSLAMAPALLVGQFCDVVDLDGAALLAKDRAPSVRYGDGFVECPPAVWG